MSYNIKTISVFERQSKRLLKKYPSLKSELLELIQSLKTDPAQGIPIGHHCFKIRLAISSKGKGKSGGARVITNFAVLNKTVFLLSIFDKSEQESLSDKEIKELLSLIDR